MASKGKATRFPTVRIVQKERVMNTRKIIVYGLIAVLFTPAFIALSMTSCEQPTDPPEPTLTGITADYTAEQTGGTDGTETSTGIVFTFSASVNSLKLTAADITVSGAAAKGTSAKLTGTGTSLTLAPITVNAAGLATVAIAKNGIEAGTKHVKVYRAGKSVPTITGITAVYNGTAAIYPSTPLNNLKEDLTVKVQYSDGSEYTLYTRDYNLNGTLTVGTSTITVSYEGKTTTFNVTVTVTAAPEYWSITWHLNDGAEGTGAYPTQIIKGTVLARPSPDPTKTGSVFSGWYSDSGLAQPYTFANLVTTDLNLYAKWYTPSGDSMNDAIPLTVNQWADGSLPTSSDVQWFTFTATASWQYIHVSFGTLTDLYVQVYDSGGTAVGSQTNLYGSTTITSRSLTAGQTYYIRVRPYYGSGTYRIGFTASTTAP